ncbi:acyltransferase family protein [Pseudoalteromonas carrageenovora]|uniref:acyltransferase family protein n=1 Tax=Pseudoalteromonas carrageenovora TaxID=227 RepID=UPI00311EDA7C
MQFRKDINGLRAIAVLAVVVFHFNPNWLPGGFAGVDVFFVISGYLMTGIIFKKFDKESFSLINFYVARARRIIPALAALCFVLLIYGWMFLIPAEFQLLSKHTLVSIGFFSNMAYWRESGYFDAISHEKWLLHTWSLSVEWQFYIIYPAILLFLKRKLSLTSIKKVILFSTIISFLYCVYSSYSTPSLAYYFLPSRAWEMMLGGLAYLYPIRLTNKANKSLQVLGVIMIALSYALVDESNYWPGYLAVIPCLGAYLIILANDNYNFLTGNYIFQKIGLWSYSIYLWHWPLVVYYYEHSGGHGTSIAYMLLSVALGLLSFRYIESIGFKQLHRNSIINLLKFKPVLFALFIGTCSIAIYMSGGADSQLRTAASSDTALYLKQYQKVNYLNKEVKQAYKAQCNFYDGSRAKTHIADSCVDNGVGGVFVWGDSHAQALGYGLRKTLRDVNFNQVATSGCRPLIKEDTFSKGEFKKACDKSNKKAKEAVLKIRPSIIVLAQKLEHDKNDYFEIEAFLEENNINAYIILAGPVPQWRPSLPKAIVKRHFDTQKKYIKDIYFVKAANEVNNILSQRYKHTQIHFVSIIDSLCREDGKCLAKVDNDNTPLVWDYGHLSLEGSLYIAENIFKPVLINALNSQ